MTDGERDPTALADVLRKRSSLLETLADGPLTQRDLRDELDVSRSTVYKALQELESAGLVVGCPEGYALTGLGRLAWRRHDAHLARLDRLTVADRLLASVPPDQRLPLSLFEHGRVYVSGRHAPERPLEQMEARSEVADRLRCFSPSGMPRYLGNIHERVEADRQTATLVLERPALERLEAEYDRFEAVRSEPDIEFRRVREELPFALVLFDDGELGFFAYDDGVLVGGAFSDDPDVVRWGERRFERRYERSNPA